MNNVTSGAPSINFQTAKTTVAAMDIEPLFFYQIRNISALAFPRMEEFFLAIGILLVSYFCKGIGWHACLDGFWGWPCLL
jgi:hypothetical protein